MTYHVNKNGLYLYSTIDGNGEDKGPTGETWGYVVRDAYGFDSLATARQHAVTHDASVYDWTHRKVLERDSLPVSPEGILRGEPFVLSRVRDLVDHDESDVVWSLLGWLYALMIETTPTKEAVAAFQGFIASEHINDAMVSSFLTQISRFVNTGGEERKIMYKWILGSQELRNKAMEWI